LEEVLDLVFCVLLGQSADEQLARAIIDLGGDDAHRHGVNDRNRPAWLNFRVLVKFRRAPDTQDHIVVADTIKLDGC